MLWLFDNEYNKKYDFYQIFINDKNEIEKNEFYNLQNIISIDTNNYNKITISYEIKIIDNMIMYTNIDTNLSISFSFTTNFIKPDQNKFKKVIFNNKYILISNDKIPNINKNLYHSYYKIKFTILKINENLLFIKENNIIDNSIRNYWITDNLLSENIYKYLE